MSWLRSSPMRHGQTRNGNNGSTLFSTGMNNNGSNGSQSISILRQRPIDTATDCDPQACYDSFRKHWQQAYDIIQRSKLPQKPPTHDDVLGVVSHLDYMVTLLLVELHHCNKISLPTSESEPPAPCLEYMLSENLLDKLYEWGVSTGRYANAVRLEQLKLYELLVSYSRHQLLCHEPFLRPLLKILGSSQGEIYPSDLEKRLVILLNQLCVVLMQNVDLLDLFFFSSEQEQYKQNGCDPSRTGPTTNFIIFSLLIPFVHREGSLGHQARDALLLCMALSQKNSNIGTYIAQYSSMCPLLVTGLGGLYSRLPNSIQVTSIEWHRITPDDVTDIPELMLFMNALEFCNAVIQVAHEMIKNQLLDFMYQGFIVPVLGPAVLQTLKGKHFQTNIESQISAMSYLDLILRSITEPELLRAFIKFLLDTEKFDGERIIDTLIDRLNSTDSNLSLVTMALFDTLLSLHCEDIMLELLLQYLLPGKHIPISHRYKINQVDSYTNTAEFFLNLTPEVMKRARELTKHKSIGATVTQYVQTAQPTLPSPTSTMSKTIGANWNYYGLHTGNSLYSNFYAYLFEAHYRIAQCESACSSWSNSYKYQKWPQKSLRQNAHTMELLKQFFMELDTNLLSNPITCVESVQICDNNEKKHDSLQSIGESSGYESFKWRPTDEDNEHRDIESPIAMPNVNSSDVSTGNGDLSKSSNIGSSSKPTAKIDPWRISTNHNELNLTDLDFSEDLFTQGTINLGPFLNAILSKLETFTSNTIFVNFHLTGLITRLAWYPLPLIHSLLLRPDIVITSDTASFHQILRILKQQIDAELPVIEDSLEIVDVARSNLIDREFRLLNARKPNENSPLHMYKGNGGQNQRMGQQIAFANTPSSSASSIQESSLLSYDAFKRNESKRKSISKSISNMFSRKTNNASTGLSQIYAFFTGSTNLASTSANNNTLAAKSVQQYNTGTTTTTTLGISQQMHETSLSTQPNNLNEDTPTHSSLPNQIFNSQKLSNASQSLVMGSGSNTQTLSAGGPGSEPISLESLPSMGTIANTSGNERTRDLALCAVLLDEWLQELAAVAQEQTIVMINKNV